MKTDLLGRVFDDNVLESTCHRDLHHLRLRDSTVRALAIPVLLNAAVKDLPVAFERDVFAIDDEEGSVPVGVSESNGTCKIASEGRSQIMRAKREKEACGTGKRRKGLRAYPSCWLPFLWRDLRGRAACQLGQSVAALDGTSKKRGRRGKYLFGEPALQEEAECSRGDVVKALNGAGAPLDKVSFGVSTSCDSETRGNKKRKGEVEDHVECCSGCKEAERARLLETQRGLLEGGKEGEGVTEGEAGRLGRKEGGKWREKVEEMRDKRALRAAGSVFFFTHGEAREEKRVLLAKAIDQSRSGNTAGHGAIYSIWCRL
jgi:hypothetical protein